jgi:type IV secretory pathway VirB10-like protein
VEPSAVIAVYPEIAPSTAPETRDFGQNHCVAARARTTAMRHFRTALVVLAMIIIAAATAWFFPLMSEESGAQAAPQTALAATPGSAQENDGAQNANAQENEKENGQTPPEAAPAVQSPSPVEAQATDPLGHLRITRQSFQRGGLGSKALVTFTLRNDNDYAVKDPEILCAFRSGDGSYATERSRTIHDTVNSKSRKTFPQTLMGFVNIKASEAKCSLLAASRGQAQPYHPKARSVSAHVRRTRGLAQLRRVGRLLWALRN